MTSPPPLKLGYVLIESEKLDEWEAFARDGLGLHADRLSPDELALRVDEHERRIIVRRGPAEDVLALGWETDGDAALAQMRDHLCAKGVTTSTGSDAESNARGVQGFFGFLGHKGLRFEFFSNPKRTNAPLAAKIQNWVTGDGGLGHSVFFSRRPEDLSEEFQQLLGAKLSDTITDKLNGVEMEFTFLHLNERHHSLAIGATAGLRLDPMRTRVQHLMFEAETLKDVSDAYVRCKELGYRIAMGMGQHPNDHAIGFYVVCPSGFEIEISQNSRMIEDEWEVGEYRGISRWGHQPEFVPTLREKLGMMLNAVKSLRSGKAESRDAPPA